MADLTLTGIVKNFGNTRVLHPMDIRIENGEFIVVVGPSGCGKSTILRLIAGLEQVTKGEICINGESVNGVEPKDRDIAMVFQNYALYPHMSVFNNMAYGLKLRKMTKDEIRQRVDEAAKLLQLETLLDRKPKELSGGQRQRVAMGRAIVRHPSVFLFDEPLSNLDAKLRATMRVELKKLHSTLKTTMIYVTHDQVEAMTLADRILVVNQGRIEQIGTPRELFLYPETLFTARFIGSPEINLMSASLFNGRIQYQKLGLNFNLPPDFSDGRDCICGIRPEHLKISPFRSEPDIRFTVQVDLVESLGADSLYYFDYGAKEPLIARTSRELNLKSKDKVEIGFFWNKTLFFDSKTGRRIPMSYQ